MHRIIERADKDLRPVRGPRDARNRTPDLKPCNGMLSRLVPALPDAHAPVVRGGREQLDARTAREGAVQRVDDFIMRGDLEHALAGCDVRERERAVCGDGVEEGRVEGPLEV